MRERRARGRGPGVAGRGPRPRHAGRARGRPGRRRRRGPGRAVRGPAPVRHRRAAGRARCRAEPHEPRAGSPGRGRAGGVAARAPPRSDRVDGVVVGFDARHKSADFADDTCRGPGRGRHPVAPAAGAAAHAGPRLRRPPPRLGGRGDGDRQPQPADGQRLQGLRPVRARRSCRRPTPRSRPRSTRSDRWPACRSASSTDPLVHRIGPELRRRVPRRGAADAPVEPVPARPVPARPVPARSDRVLGDARRGRRDRRGPARPGRLRAPGAGRRAVRARPRLPDRGVPEPRGARRDGPVAGHGGAGRRRRRGGQRPRRRPAGGGHPGVAGSDGRAGAGGWRMLRGRRGGCAARRRGAGRPAGRAGGPGPARARAGLQPRVVAAARSHGRRRRHRLRGDAHRVQVDRPFAGAGPAAALRLRGGARLLRGRPRRRQGRHQRPARSWCGGSPRSAARARRWPIGSTRWPGATASTPPVRSRSGPRASTGWPASPRRCAGCGRSPPHVGRRAIGRAVRGPRRRRRPAASCRPATSWSCTSTVPGSSSARAAPSPSSSATSRWSSPSPARWPTARAEAETALDEVAAAMTSLLALAPIVCVRIGR